MKEGRNGNVVVPIGVGEYEFPFSSKSTDNFDIWNKPIITISWGIVILMNALPILIGSLLFIIPDLPDPFAKTPQTTIAIVLSSLWISIFINYGLGPFYVRRVHLVALHIIITITCLSWMMFTYFMNAKYLMYTASVIFVFHFLIYIIFFSLSVESLPKFEASNWRKIFFGVPKHLKITERYSYNEEEQGDAVITFIQYLFVLALMLFNFLWCALISTLYVASIGDQTKQLVICFIHPVTMHMWLTLSVRFTRLIDANLEHKIVTPAAILYNSMSTEYFYRVYSTTAGSATTFATMQIIKILSESIIFIVQMTTWYQYYVNSSVIWMCKSPSPEEFEQKLTLARHTITMRRFLVGISQRFTASSYIPLVAITSMSYKASSYNINKYIDDPKVEMIYLLIMLTTEFIAYMLISYYALRKYKINLNLDGMKLLKTKNFFVFVMIMFTSQFMTIFVYWDHTLL